MALWQKFHRDLWHLDLPSEKSFFSDRPWLNCLIKQILIRWGSTECMGIKLRHRHYDMPWNWSNVSRLEFAIQNVCVRINIMRRLISGAVYFLWYFRALEGWISDYVEFILILGDWLKQEACILLVYGEN